MQAVRGAGREGCRQTRVQTKVQIDRFADKEATRVQTERTARG
jgi:hypothetical protein